LVARSAVFELDRDRVLNEVNVAEENLHEVANGLTFGDRNWPTRNIRARVLLLPPCGSTLQFKGKHVTERDTRHQEVQVPCAELPVRAVQDQGEPPRELEGKQGGADVLRGELGRVEGTRYHAGHRRLPRFTVDMQGDPLMAAVEAGLRLNDAEEDSGDPTEGVTAAVSEPFFQGLRERVDL